MSNPTSNFNWQMPTATDLVTDLPADFEVFGQAVDTSLADLKGGTTNQVLAKNSNADMDFKWVADAAGMTNPMTTTGDTIYSSSGSTPARLGIGTAGQILRVNSGATAPEWATPAGGGKVLQVVSTTYSTQTYISDTTFVDTNLSLAITPSSATSKILVLVTQQASLLLAAGSSNTFSANGRLLRNSTTIMTMTNFHGDKDSANQDPDNGGVLAMTYLDSPNTTSAVTYKTQGSTNSAQQAVAFQRSGSTSSITLMEIGA
jgi:hypothetical protein